MKDQTITFAAICQVAHLVQQISRNGLAFTEQENADLAVLLQSITETSPENTLAVYGNQLVNVKHGLQLLIDHLGDNSPKFR